MANAVSNVTELLNEFNVDPDYTYLAVAAWVCKVGIIDVIANTTTFQPHHLIYVMINNNLKKMTIQEAYNYSIERLKSTASGRGRVTYSKILGILSGDEDFYEVDRQIPEEQKKKILG